MKLRLCLLLALTIVWLVPFFWAGFKGYLPFKTYSRLSFQYNAAGLFTKKTVVWTHMLIQVQRKGSSEWEVLDKEEVSPMGAFGYRQRLDRILQESKGSYASEKVRERMANWIARACAERQPERGEVTAVRFGQIIWTASSPELAMPTGHWVNAMPTDGSEARVRQLSEYSVHGGKARRLWTATSPRDRSTPPPLPAIPPRAVIDSGRPVEASASAPKRPL